MRYSSKKSQRESNIEDINNNKIEFVYYITSASHLQSILKHGILSHNQARAKVIIKEDISLAGVQQLRSRKIIDGKSLHDYACLYFCATNPMLYKVQKEFSDIIIVAVDKKILLNKSSLFSNGNAASDNTKFYSGTEYLETLPWSKIRADYWRDPNFDSGHYSEDDLVSNERSRIKCAEILIYPNIPSKYVKGVFCNSKEVMSFCQSITSKKLHILIDKRIFF